MVSVLNFTLLMDYGRGARYGLMFSMAVAIVVENDFELILDTSISSLGTNSPPRNGPSNSCIIHK